MVRISLIASGTGTPKTGDKLFLGRPASTESVQNPQPARSDLLHLADCSEFLLKTRRTELDHWSAFANGISSSDSPLVSELRRAFKMVLVKSVASAAISRAIFYDSRSFNKQSKRINKTQYVMNFMTP